MLLERKWPEKYNAYGHSTWAGRLYGKGFTQALASRRGRIYHGTWGSALFQSVYQSPPGSLGSLPLMPEWYLILAALGGLSAVGLLWRPLALALPLLALAAGASLVQAGLSAARASFKSSPGSRLGRLQRFGLTAFLHLLQPGARLVSRLRWGLTPWRRRGARGFAWPWSRTVAFWAEKGRPAEDRLRSVEGVLREERAIVRRGGDYDRWDLEVRDGNLGGARLCMTIEEHGAGRQMVRFRAWPSFSPGGGMLTLLFAALFAGAALDDAWTASAILGGVTGLLAVHLFRDCIAAMGALLRALRRAGKGEA